MRLLKLDKRVQQMVVDEMISTGHARALLSLENDELQYTVAQKIFDEKLSVRETEKLVKSILNPKSRKNPGRRRRSCLSQPGGKIKSIVGTKVLIQRKGKIKERLKLSTIPWKNWSD